MAVSYQSFGFGFFFFASYTFRKGCRELCNMESLIGTDKNKQKNPQETCSLIKGPEKGWPGRIENYFVIFSFVHPTEAKQKRKYNPSILGAGPHMEQDF